MFTISNEVKLSERLAAVAGLVPRGGALADIGTDHAYLPISLMQAGRIRSAVAADIKKGPLETAAKNIKKYGFEKSIRTVLSNGLEKLDAGSFDTLVIAGMGGETIEQIIDAAPYLKSKGYLLILQPQTRAEGLRKYLYENGFRISKDILVLEGRKLYNVICAVYEGDPISYSPIELYVSSQMRKDPTEHYFIYIKKLRAHFQKQLEGLQAGKKASAQRIQELQYFIDETERYLNDQG